MRFFVVAESVLEVNELCLNDAILKVKKATGEEVNTAMQQGLKGKSFHDSRFNLQCYYICHVANFIYLCSIKP